MLNPSRPYLLAIQDPQVVVIKDSILQCCLFTSQTLLEIPLEMRIMFECRILQTILEGTATIYPRSKKHSNMRINY